MEINMEPKTYLIEYEYFVVHRAQREVKASSAIEAMKIADEDQTLIPYQKIKVSQSQITVCSFKEETK